MAQVEVVYVPDKENMWHTTHILASGMTVADVLDVSGVFLRYPNALNLPVGIFSKPVEKDRLLQAGDRVALYRPLLGDPKEKRRKRAKSTRIQT
ncbi:MAG: RnfH family protein [Gammaproteobacteria bacterium]|nr:RnfH family protein [Gammaproteobacteria bacterium]MCH9717548.1 RnfH family protein [Gammaproteobacteria bacterium]MCH9764100.1 RnfH family protein [Gammaproteobacteria bacterium]